MSKEVSLTDTQKEIFEKITKNDVDGLKVALAQHKTTVNFVDENDMTPLQHACYKGNRDAVQMLLDQGADVSYSKHSGNYTCLHFAALSGKPEVCLQILEAGIDPTVLNVVNRTASQMAAFVNNHACVATINNFIPKSNLTFFAETQPGQTEPALPPEILDKFHKFVCEITIHPVRVALNIQKHNLLKYLPKIRAVLMKMCELEMKKPNDVNELMALKFHYLGWIVSELIKSEEHILTRKEKSTESEEDSKNNFLELFIKRALKLDKSGKQDYIEWTIKDCIREFPYRETTIFRQVISMFDQKEPHPAEMILRTAINGQRGFSDDIVHCSTCGEEKPGKKCSKCKEVQYCDRECQRLHWFVHKKMCARPTSSSTAAKPVINQREVADEVSRHLSSLQV